MEYLIPIFLSIFYSLKYDRLGLTPLNHSRFLFIMIWLMLLSAFQYCIGFDTPFYMEAYKEVPHLTYEEIFEDARYRPRWQLLQVFCHKFSNDFLFFKILQAVFISVCVYTFLRRYSKFVFLSTFFYILYEYGNLNFGAMRQSFSIGIFLLSLRFLEHTETKRATIISYLKYFGMAYLASFFHTSALVLFLVPLFRVCVKSNKLMFLSFIGLFVFSVFISSLPNFNQMVYMAISSDEIEQNARFYLTSEDYAGRVGFFNILFSYIPIFIAFLCLYLNRYNSSSRFMVLKTIMFGYLIMAAMNLAIPIFYRFNDYFVFAYIALMPNAIYEDCRSAFRRRSRNVLVSCCLFSLFILYPVHHLFAIHPSFGQPGYSIYYPYYSVFNPQIDPARRSMY